MRNFSHRDSQDEDNNGSVSPLSHPPSPVSHDRRSLGWGLSWRGSSPAVPDKYVPTQQAQHKSAYVPNNRGSTYFYPPDLGNYQVSLGGPSSITHQVAQPPACYPPTSQPQPPGYARRSSQQRGDRTPYPQQRRFPDGKSGTHSSKSHQSRSTTKPRKSPHAAHQARPLTPLRMPVRPAQAATSRARPAATAAAALPDPHRYAHKPGGRSFYEGHDRSVGQRNRGTHEQREQMQAKPKNRGCCYW